MATKLESINIKRLENRKKDGSELFRLRFYSHVTLVDERIVKAKEVRKILIGSGWNPSNRLELSRIHVDCSLDVYTGFAGE